MSFVICNNAICLASLFPYIVSCDSLCSSKGTVSRKFSLGMFRIHYSLLSSLSIFCLLSLNIREKNLYLLLFEIVYKIVFGSGEFANNQNNNFSVNSSQVCKYFTVNFDELHDTVPLMCSVTRFFISGFF
jgi:hypothetical protein